MGAQRWSSETHRGRKDHGLFLMAHPPPLHPHLFKMEMNFQSESLKPFGVSGLCAPNCLRNGPCGVSGVRVVLLHGHIPSTPRAQSLPPKQALDSSDPAGDPKRCLGLPGPRVDLLEVCQPGTRKLTQIFNYLHFQGHGTHMGLFVPTSAQCQQPSPRVEEPSSEVLLKRQSARV